MNKGIMREALSMRRRGYQPEAIMRKWRITPEQYAAMLDMNNSMSREVAGEVDAWSRRDRNPAPTGMSETAGY